MKVCLLLLLRKSLFYGNARSKVTFLPKKVFLPKNVHFHSYVQDTESSSWRHRTPGDFLNEAYYVLVNSQVRLIAVTNNPQIPIAKHNRDVFLVEWDCG